MSKPNDGGPAFPCSAFLNQNNEVVTAEDYCLGGNGMTLRDYFAGQALAGFLASPLFKGDLNSALDDAFRAADAMIERMKR